MKKALERLQLFEDLVLDVSLLKAMLLKEIHEKYKKITINEDATTKKALKVISKGNIKIAVVVDKKGKLLATLTDGDIRRGF